MSTLISVAIILVCILLILIVLVQNSKGGGLASSFSSSNQVMGVRKTADFLEKATWTLAVALLVLSLLSAAYTKPSDSANAGKSSATRSVGANKADDATSGGTALPVKPDSAK
jgi:preprotein translocase subunit SecG